MIVPDGVGQSDGALFMRPYFWYITPESSRNKNDCFIHALNFFAETPLFRTRESFLKININRKKSNQQWIRKDVAFRGVSIANLHRIIYDPENDKFFTPVS
jgi:hypothetical protein